MNVELRVQALMWEYERAMELMERGVVSGVVAYRYMGASNRPCSFCSTARAMAR